MKKKAIPTTQVGVVPKGHEDKTAMLHEAIALLEKSGMFNNFLIIVDDSQNIMASGKSDGAFHCRALEALKETYLMAMHHESGGDIENTLAAYMKAEQGSAKGALNRFKQSLR